MRLSDAYANAYLNYLLGKTTKLEAPTQVWAGLSTNDPEASGGTFTEVSGNGYGRILLSISNQSFPADISSASGREIKNVKQLVFPKATGAYTVKGIGLFSAETGGTPFATGVLGTKESPITVNVTAGALPMFEISGFELFVTG